MKKHSLLLALGLGAAVLTLTGHAQDLTAQADLQQRVETLEKELTESRAETAGLLDALTQNTQTLDRLETWVEAQAKSAAAMAATLDTSEAQGFTAGINYQSRETLLAGWRKALGETQKGLQGAKPAKAEAEPKNTSRN